MRKTSNIPKLATVMIGDNPASKLYIKLKGKACDKAGIEHIDIRLPINTFLNVEIIKRNIKNLNNDKSIDAILIQLPLPRQFRKHQYQILSSLLPEKDVDCLTPTNIGKLFSGDETIASCTAKGIIKLLPRNLKGKHVVIINHSIVLGKPLTAMLLNRNATVTICHKHTKNLSEHTKNADIIVNGTGIELLKLIESIPNWNDVIIIDTTIKGTIGPMTIKSLIENVKKLSKR